MATAARANPVAAIEAGDPVREESRVSPVILSDMRIKYCKLSFSILVRSSLSLKLGAGSAQNPTGEGEMNKRKDKKMTRKLLIRTGFYFRQFFAQKRCQSAGVGFIFANNIFETGKFLIKIF